jgi:GTP-binding protein
MFIDKATIQLNAGNGGDGAVAFHREKYVASGGPSGGDGGDGGNIYFQADDKLATLADFRFKRKYAAQSGIKGGESRCSGKKGEHLLLKVPRGTLVREAETGRLLADVSGDEPILIAKGGRGGWGNTHFATPTRQTPRFAKSGTPGESLQVELEMKLLADVGLLGFPNVGKSSFLTAISEARPVIGNYPFTTISPALGVVTLGLGDSFVVADIPGLIEGASAGAGLGLQFLRHVERCRMLIHILDVSGSEDRDPIADFQILNKELAAYLPQLAGVPQLVAANKTDLATEEQIEQLKNYIETQGYVFFTMCAPIQEGTKEVIQAAAALLKTLPPIKRYDPEPEAVPDPEAAKGNRFAIFEEDSVYSIEAPWLLKILRKSDMEDYESLQYFQRVLLSSGIIDALVEAGIQEGDTVSIYDFAFDYVS